MSPFMAMFSLVVALGANVAPGQLTWERDYRQARQLGERLQKPLAVVVGSGAEGWTRLAREGKFDSSVNKLLADGFVRVYIDVNTESGRKLADAFGLSSKCGLVISDRTGDLQAFWHNGDLTLSDLNRLLNKYGSTSFVVRTTETYAPAAPLADAYVQPASYQNYYQPACHT